MIARVWRGTTRAKDADAYLDYLRRTSGTETPTMAGNRGMQVWRRITGDEAEFTTVIYWESLDAIRAFAGEEIERAIFYPEDDRYLVTREPTVTHYEVFDVAAPATR
jgi:heme-degrading monooxygenase HmoA